MPVDDSAVGTLFHKFFPIPRKFSASGRPPAARAEGRTALCHACSIARTGWQSTGPAGRARASRSSPRCTASPSRRTTSRRSAMMRPADEGLTTIDIDMAQQLQNYSKKITQLRKASGNDAPLSRPRRERRKRNRRTRQLRSEAEDYRRARLAQRVVWVICSVQMLSTVLLAVLSHPAFGVTLIGYGFGMAASFSRVQRHHGVCMVFNVAYGLVSFGEPSALLAEIVQAGSPEGLMRKLPRLAVGLG